MKYKKLSKFSILGFLLLFLTISVAVTISVIVYAVLINKIGKNYLIICIIMFFVILVLASVCSLIDMIRRYKMVENPTEQILDATQKITQGNFKIKLIPNHSYSKFDQYDIIMDNINTMAQELQKNEVLKSDFISNVSHEIKTPLSILQSYATALLNKKLDEKTKEKYINTLVSTSKKLSDLISNILKLNKLENQQILDMEEINFGELLREKILELEELIEKKDLIILCDISDVKVISCLSFLEIIINNLLSNAIKFTERNGTISISLKHDGEFVVLKISDSGVGIDEDTGKHIFDKFYQGDTSHNAEGNGLGLALVKKVIDNIGGKIAVESEVNKGSTFTVTLQKKQDKSR